MRGGNISGGGGRGRPFFFLVIFFFLPTWRVLLTLRESVIVKWRRCILRAKARNRFKVTLISCKGEILYIVAVMCSRGIQNDFRGVKESGKGDD